MRPLPITGMLAGARVEIECMAYLGGRRAAQGPIAALPQCGEGVLGGVYR